MSTNSVQIVKSHLGGGYDILVNNERVGQVVKVERRNPVMVQDGGYHYSIGTVADPFKWATLDDRGRTVRWFRTRAAAVESVVRFSTTGR